MCEKYLSNTLYETNGVFMNTLLNLSCMFITKIFFSMHNILINFRKIVHEIDLYAYVWTYDIYKKCSEYV